MTMPFWYGWLLLTLIAVSAMSDIETGFVAMMCASLASTIAVAIESHKRMDETLRKMEDKS